MANIFKEGIQYIKNWWEKDKEKRKEQQQNIQLTEAGKQEMENWQKFKETGKDVPENLQKTGQFIRDVTIAPPARGIISTGISLASNIKELATGKPAEKTYKPEGFITKFIGEEPIKAMDERVKETQKMSMDITGKSKIPGVKESGVFAGPLILGVGLSLDLLPFYGGAGKNILKNKKVMEKIVKETDPNEIFKVLKPFLLNSDDNSVKLLSSDLSKLSKEDDVFRYFSNINPANLEKNSIKSSKTEIYKKAKNYESADELIKNKNLDKNMSSIYNEIYGQKDTNKFIIPEGLRRGQGLPGDGGTRTAGSLSQDIEGSLSEISEFINKNPKGFTLNLKGKPASSGFAVSPYKGREMPLDQVDETSLRSFLLNNFDLLKEKSNHFGGWLNEKDGKFYLDISKVVDNVDDAIGYAVHNNQIGIYDLKKDETIFTKDFLKSKLKNIWEESNSPIFSLEDIVNREDITRMNLDLLVNNDTEKKALKTFIEANPDVMKKTGSPLTFNEIRERAARQSELILETQGREEVAEEAANLYKIGMKSKNLIKELTKKHTPEEIQAIKQELKSSMRVLTDIKTNKARILNSAKAIANDADNTILDEIINKIKKDNDILEKVIDEADKVNWDDVKEVNKFYRKYVKPTGAEILREYRYNNMLSSPKTLMRNVFGNMFQTVALRPATQAAQDVTETMKYFFTGGKQGQIANPFKGMANYYQGMFESTSKAGSTFSDIMTGKYRIKHPDISKGIDIPTSLNPISQALRIPSKILEATDRSLMDLISGGLENVYKSRGKDILKAKEEAKKIAQYSLFRAPLDPKNKTGQGVVLGAVDKVGALVDASRKQLGVGDWFVPFLRTPLNITKQWLEYAPGIGLSTMIKSSRKSEQLAKQMIGSSVMLWAAKKSAQNETTWSVPKSETGKEYFYAANAKPYSVKIGNAWVPMIYLGPLAYAFAIPAAYKYYNEDAGTALTDNQYKKTTKAVGGLVQLLGEQTFVKNIGEFIDLAEGGDTDFMSKLEKVGANMVNQIIPLSGLVRWVNQSFIDPVYRDADNFLEEIERSLPWLSQNVKPYTTPTGEVSVRDKSNILIPWDLGYSNKHYQDMLDAYMEGTKYQNYYDRHDEKMRDKVNDILLKLPDTTDVNKIQELLKPVSENKDMYNMFKNQIEDQSRHLKGLVQPYYIFENKPSEMAAIIAGRIDSIETTEDAESFQLWMKGLEEAGIWNKKTYNSLYELYYKDQVNEASLEEESSLEEQEQQKVPEFNFNY